VIVPVSASNGEINIWNGSGSAINVVGDLAGYFTTSTTGQYYHPANPVHVVDTRSAKSGAVASDGTIGFSTPSSLTAGNPSLVLNVTVVSPTDAGYLNAYPGSKSSPGTSIGNFAAGSTLATRHHRQHRGRERLRHRQRVGQREQHHHRRHRLLRLELDGKTQFALWMLGTSGERSEQSEDAIFSAVSWRWPRINLNRRPPAGPPSRQAATPPGQPASTRRPRPAMSCRFARITSGGHRLRWT
jgi:hypothetical protein